MPADAPESEDRGRTHSDSFGVLAALRLQGWTIASAESLTAGLVAAGLADVPGCSDVLRGAVVAYQPDVKAAVLDVSQTALSDGVVSRRVALEMAYGARRLLGADVAVATTGVAGPEPHGGEPVGSVWIAVVTPDAEQASHLSLTGDRARIRAGTVEACWSLLLETIGNT